MEYYQVIFKDEWDTLTDLGFFASLSAATNAINETLQPYEIAIKEDDLKVYPHTLGPCFDVSLYDLFESEVEAGEVAEEVCSLQIRGFIRDIDEDIKLLKSIRKECQHGDKKG